MSDVLALLQRDQWIGLGILFIGAGVFYWGVAHVRGRQVVQGGWAIRLGAAVWARLVGAALIIVGGVFMIGGAQLLIGARTLT